MKTVGVRHNRLFYLRDLRGKASRVDTQEEILEAPPSAPAAEASAEGQAAAAPAPKGKKGKAGKSAATASQS